MDVFAQFEACVGAIIEELKAEGVLPGEASVRGPLIEQPRDPSHGELATSAALMLAKAAKSSPRALAETIAARLEAADNVLSAEVAGPGFINLRLEPSVWQSVVRSILDAPETYGRGGVMDGGRINVEYVSVNPTGPLHVGHCRGAVFGDALASLLRYAGYDVTREYYINDAGAQVDTLARSAFLRYREALGEDIGTIPEGFYPGDYLIAVGARLREIHGEALLGGDEADWLPVVREVALEMMMDLIRADLATLNIRHDLFFSERSLIEGERDRVQETIETLRARGLVYEGRLEAPKGVKPDDWEDREQTLFRSTDFGDDVDRALIKSDGSYTYFASDMAYHEDKFRRGFKVLIDVWGADHAGYIKRVGAAVEALTEGQAEFDVKVVQLVKLFRGGEPVTMSKRAGTYVTLRDAVDEVGSDPIRFMMLYRKNEAPLDFDFKAVTEQAKENPVFYVQYAHARIQSGLRRAESVFEGIEETVDGSNAELLSVLDDEGELRLMRKIAVFPRMISAAAAAHEPHRIAFYLYDLASDLHFQWNRGKDVPHLRFIREDDQPLTVARVALVKAVRTVLASGLGILGVRAPDEMR